MLRHYLVALFNDPRDLPVLERDGRVHFEPEARTCAFVNVHDFVDKQLGKAIPYGVYDVGANAGCVSVGVDHDTAEFAVNAIRRWLAAKTGLTVRCELDENTYAKGVKVSDAEMVVIYRRNIAWTCLTNLYLRQCS